MGNNKKNKKEDADDSAGEEPKVEKVEVKSKKARKKDKELEEAQREMESLVLGEELSVKEKSKSKKKIKAKKSQNKKIESDSEESGRDEDDGAKLTKNNSSRMEVYSASESNPDKDFSDDDQVKKETQEEDLDQVLAELNMDKPKIDDDGLVIAEEDEATKAAALKKKEKKARKKNKLPNETSEENPSEKNEHGPMNDQDNEDIVEDNKKKKKKGAKDEDDKKKKKPAKGTLLAMQEALKKVQEEETQRRKEEEERIAREDLLETERLQKKRLEEERKQAKKEREKAKKEQLRKEGKLLSAKQKQQKAQAETMLAAMRAQGIAVPATDAAQKEEPTTSVPEEPLKEEIHEIEEELQTKEVIKDAWDATSEEEEEELVEEQKTDTSSDAKDKSSKKKDHDASKEDEGGEESEEESSDDEDSESESEEESSDEENPLSRKEKAEVRIQKRRVENESKRTTDVLRSPVVCVLGHVDTGKTKILDKLRRTNVQDGEAGGITQQIGATNVPIEVVQEQCKNVKDVSKTQLKLPGLLIIDTPGHESFSNLRDRGSSLCDIAILVVDIMHNLEPQTIESINLLKKKKTPFVVALNKLDRIYEWKSNRHKDIQDVVESQSPNTRMEFNKRAQEVITALAEQGLNASLFWGKLRLKKTYINIVPTSAHTGEGMGNLMWLLVSLSQSMLAKRLSFSNELQATVLEVKAIPGLGTTIDIVLVNGKLSEGSTIVVAGTDGPIVTQIKALLTPSKMQDLRVKVSYLEHKEIQAAQGVKISAKDLEKAIAGLNVLVAYKPDEVDISSTLGSLEALLEFLKSSKVPYAGVKIGPVVKRDVMKASVMLERESKYTIILAFDVKIERDAQEMADSMGVKIFQADIIYHLFDRFAAYQEELKRQKKEQHKHIAVFPCKLKILPNCVFNSRDPIVAGFIVEAGVVRPGTPLCVPSRDKLDIGFIEPIPGESPKMFDRHFTADDPICSKITRTSIDACKKTTLEKISKNQIGN
ncbi:EIF5B [Lepeophtheirus salmonis]|uniref:Eukaryotic translation initiation factor 5B n=1 Tax=Lepeophtheirus salmonis TaxID=72036 RepID=A0A7R8HAP4_LEPSM|nr:EIF5B [Lepeophtheirus salmonis]CAF2978590.1 EIF5B [Lepeophtheirus salmonis]